MIHPGAFAGNLKDNPVRDDIEETADFISVDFILNVALDDHKRIAFAAAGHPVEAHRKACAFLDKIYKKKVKKRQILLLFLPVAIRKTSICTRRRNLSIT